jgi:hypothetical protein
MPSIIPTENNFLLVTDAHDATSMVVLLVRYSSFGLQTKLGSSDKEK